MGYNLFGYLVKKDHKDIPAMFGSVKGKQVVKKGQVTFEDATYYNDDAFIFDIYETDKGSLILCDSEMVSDNMARKLSEGTEVMTYRMSETSMTFMFEKYTNGSLLWEDSAVFEEEVQRMGEAMVIKEDEDVVFTTFPKLTQEYVGIDFHEADDAMFVRYTLVDHPVQSTPPPLSTDNGPIGKTDRPPMSTDIGQTVISDYRSEAETHYDAFMREIILNKKPGVVAEKEGKTVCSIESYLRIKGIPAEKVHLYCTYLKSEAFKTRLDEKQKHFSKTAKAVNVKFIIVMVMVILLVYLVVSFLASIFLDSVAWSFQFFAFFCAVCLVIFLLPYLKGKGRKKRHITVTKIFDSDEEPTLKN
jgi:hypothetical protein